MSKKADCDICTEPNAADNMVRCDNCKAWLHYGCAGVDDSVKNRQFVCKKCRPGSSAMAESVRTAGGTPTSVANITLVPASRSVRSGASSSRNQRVLDLELLRLKEQKDLEKVFLDKKYELLKLKEQQDEDNSSVSSDGRSVVSRSRVGDVKCDGGSVVRRTKDWVAQSKTEVQAESTKGMLTQNQIASTKGLSKELPVFSGRSEEWPIFISNYRNSTLMCNYSNDENMVRLQRALKGKAFEAVSSQLLLPASVPAVISTLEMLFGRPEFIIEELIRKVENFPAPKIERLETIISYALAVKNLSSTMEASELIDHLNNPVLLKKLVDKLPSTMKMEWAMGASNIQRNIKGFGEWMFARAQAQAVATVTRYADDGNKADKRSGHVHAHVQDSGSEPAAVNVRRDSRAKCYMCHQSHRLVDCSAFNELSVQDRRRLVAEQNLCDCCLKHSRRARCNRMKECGIAGCRLKHHPLLHYGGGNNVGACYSHQDNNEKGTLCRILPVVLYGNGKEIKTYAFLDSGSALTLLEESISKELRLNGTPKPLCLRWTANSTRREQDSEVVSLGISGYGNNNEEYQTMQLNGVRTVKSLALPSQSETKELLESYHHLKGLPVTPYTNAECGILIGLNNEKAAVGTKIREGKWNEPIALKTRLGWCLSGGAEREMESYGNFQICECDDELHDLVKQHFALEESCAARVRTASNEDVRAMEILATTTKRVDGAFECGLLWRHDVFSMPNSYQMALKRLCCLEKKMHCDPMIISNVNNQVASLLQKGYARKCSKEELDSLSPRTWFLPTFIVTNPNKPNKVRLVWDASASAQGVSLNKMLLKGPDQLQDLPDILFGFRSNKVAITGDIEEMFHQIRVREEDQCAQRFLWRNGESDRNPDIYQMEVLTFGASCSPSIALYVKDTNAAEFSKKYPRAVESILKHHYMDDLLDSVNTVEEAVQLATEVREIHSKAGFRMRGWMSNSTEVLQSLGQSAESEGRTIDCGKENNIAKVLGLWWRPNDDDFTFSLRFIKTQEDILSGERLPTKRELLRILMSIFDPLGFLAFYLVRIKVLLQDVWRKNLGWDEIIYDSLATKWESWRRLLPNVELVRIPRCYNTFTKRDAASVQLHIYVDASEDAMAAVAYLRVSNGYVTECSLVGAKVKVSPLLPVSIPTLC